MANIQEVAEALCGLTTKEVNELSQVMKSEYGIEPAVCIDREIEERQRQSGNDSALHREPRLKSRKKVFTPRHSFTRLKTAWIYGAYL